VGVGKRLKRGREVLLGCILKEGGNFYRRKVNSESGGAGNAKRKGESEDWGCLKLMFRE